MAVHVKPITEAEFTRQVITLAKLRGWRVAHFRSARTKHGWRTAISGDGAGFPDLLLVRDDRIMVRELKVGRNVVFRPQIDWLYAFCKAGVDWGVWRPENWDVIEKELK